MLLTAVLTAVLAVAGSPVCAAPKRSNLAASSHDHAVVFPPPFLLPFLLPPSRDAFYRVPDNITAYARGDIVRWRPLPSFSAFGSAAGRAYQLLYRTNGVDMLPDATVTTVVVPATPAPGPAKIVAIATPADSAAFDCQPSFALLENSFSNEAGEVMASVFEAIASLHNGYYVTIPDLEGSKAAWLAYSEGQAMLDGIRATANHRETMADNKGYQAALTGFSGGGHGSAWAAQLASTYGKGIPIVALAAGGVPADLAACLNFLDGKPQSSLVFQGVAGLSNAYPELEDYFKGIMKPNGTEAIAKVRSGMYCAPSAASVLASKSFNASTTLKYPTKGDIPQRIFALNHLGRNHAAPRDFPIFLSHSIADDTVPFDQANAYYESECAKGARILFNALPTGNHLKTGIDSVVPFFDFMRRAFDGTLKLDKCTKVDQFSVSIDSPDASTIVGPELLLTLQNVLAVAPV